MERRESAHPDAPVQESAGAAEQALFFNQCTLDYQQYLQCFRELQGVYVPLWTQYCSVAALLTGNILLAATDAGSTPHFLLHLLMIALGLFQLYLLLILPRRRARMTVHRLEETFGGLVEIQASFYGDRLILRNPLVDTDLCMLYQNIVYCGETKDLLVLMSRRKVFAFPGKSGFTGTDGEGFKAFMREKAPNAKFRW